MFSTDWSWSLFREFLPFQDMTHQFKELSKHHFREMWMLMICQRINGFLLLNCGLQWNSSQRLCLVLKESACKIFFFFIQFSHNARSTHTQRNCNHNIHGWIVDFANVNAQTKANWMVNYFAFFVDFAFYLCVRVCDSTRVCVLFMHWNHMSVGKRYIWVFFIQLLAFGCCFVVAFCVLLTWFRVNEFVTMEKNIFLCRFQFCTLLQWSSKISVEY